MVKALGANVAQIVWLFLGQVTIVAFLERSLAWAWDDVDPLPQRIQSLAGIDSAHRDFPAQRSINSRRSRPRSFRTTLLSSASALLICSFAALVPAYFAARLDPVKALRYE